MQDIPFGKRWSVFMAGIQTVFGLRRRGRFTPMKYAQTIPETPPVYREWQTYFSRHETVLNDALESIRTAAPAIRNAVAADLGEVWCRGFAGLLDSAALFTIAREGRPRRIVEVGSGVSSRILRVAARDARMTCIDPVPRADLASIDVQWEASVLDERHLPIFAELEPGDIAFFDSSHVLVQGNDVDIILNRILPALRPGVLVHFHDIFLPDPYPGAWRLRNYTEQIALSGWLLGGALALVFASHYAATRLREPTMRALEGLPGDARNPVGGSLWFRR